jgi:hypothetical protein
MHIKLIAGAVLALTFAAPAVPAVAAEWCFEGLGNTGCPWKETFPNAQLKQLSCQNLWYVRNSIYDRRGYCFKTDDAKEVFDNSDCWVKNAANIQFNKHESANISRIKKIEKNKGC